MPRATDTFRASVERVLSLRSRADVEAVEVEFAGCTTYVVKDPLTLELFQLNEQEALLLRCLDQSASLRSLQRTLQEQFPSQSFSFTAIEQGLNQLYEQGLLVSTAPHQGLQLLERAGRQRQRERWQSLLSVLSIRVVHWDATRLLDTLYRKLSWAFSLPVLLGAMVTLLYAGWILLGRGSEVVARLPALSELLQPRHLMLTVATVVTVKILHELAHGLTCKHFGARCHEMGVLLLALLPCLYCDVTDVWRLPNKWHRMAVSAAGMMLEVVLAALAVIAWWHTEPGLLNLWFLNVALVCSVGTLAVNANPLLRYDGYYILSDLLEIPNLAGRARGKLAGALGRWLSANPPPPEPLLTERQQQVVWYYSIASKLYMGIVMLAIYAMLLAWARPHRLENMVHMLGIVALTGMLAPSVRAIWKSLRNPGAAARMRPLRLAIAGSAAAAMLLVVLFWPVANTVRGPIVLVPADGEPVYVTVAGELRIAVGPGTAVQKGDVLAELVNPELELAVARQAGEQAVQQVRFEQLGAMRARDPRASVQLPTARAEAADAQALLDEYQRREDELVLRAPRSGTVLAPPAWEPAPAAEGVLASWSGSPLETPNRGCWIEPGTVLCVVGDPNQLDALIAVDQRDVSAIAVGDPVKILLSAASTRVLTGRVAQVAGRGTKTEKPEESSASATFHLVHVELDAQDLRARVGMRGSAKITAGVSTVASIVVTHLRRFLRLPW